jgi:hypothetical protein
MHRDTCLERKEIHRATYSCKCVDNAACEAKRPELELHCLPNYKGNRGAHKNTYVNTDYTEKENFKVPSFIFVPPLLTTQHADSEWSAALVLLFLYL